MANLYIHIPFCLSKCAYCSFVSFPGMSHLFDRYVEALGKEISMLTAHGQPDEPLETIFIGGGTPSLLSADHISSVLNFCRQRFRLHQQAEISMEINPKTVDFIQLMSLKESGVNRVSLGVQSFLDRELQQLGRIHTAQEAWDAAEMVRNAGFANINIDLISGLPGQTLDSWRWNLQSAISLNPDHLSLYQLSVEEGTPFYVQRDQGRLSLPDEEEIERMDVLTPELCRAADFWQYEISNYARPGFECRHNINYWLNEEYYGIGAGAVRYLAGERVKNIEDPLVYCQNMERGESVTQDREILDSEASFRESVIMGLRMVTGISAERLFRRYGIDLQLYYGEALERLVNLSLVEFEKPYLRLTAKGRALANRVMADLV
ncbi:MAG: radical SAM family heme chaperone HemW [Desulfocapsaceae bacterium]|nr:radical SAM family heme chaperone HemW [Desulfocapsaceae bacterium]